MTEKRFTIEFDGVKYFCVIDVPNERVEGRFDTISDAKGYLELYEAYIELEKENEQLKSHINDTEIAVEIETEKCMQNVFKLIDKKIDEFRNGDYGDLPCNTIHMFLDLKQELGDVE